MSVMRIRVASLCDAKELLAIYEPYVENTAITFEYDVPTLVGFCNRMETIQERYPYLVLENEFGDICGYAYASCFKPRAAYDWSVETTIYVKQNCQGLGYGRLLYTKLEEYLIRQNVLNANACIAVANDNNDHLDNTSKVFHDKMGYQLVGTFHHSGYKFSQWYDMIWMEKILGEHHIDPAPFTPFSELVKLS